ncbi:vitelline membrane outer layer protein 1 homolog isoform X2 [Artemia franciscana]|uniref:vitelline membrane outer layer protein 1 homolog isoform X2 n=1 Tax=Artemia franciscana TaxID=6661 RepID=UPI0032D9C99E
MVTSEQVEPNRGLLEDDTAVNSICISCISEDNSSNLTFKCSGEGSRGIDAGYFPCPVVNSIQTYLTAFQLKVDPEDGDIDETAVNNIQFACRSNTLPDVEYVIEGNGVQLHGASYGNWSNFCPTGSFVCGIQTKVQIDQTILDDTALNDVLFECCA